MLQFTSAVETVARSVHVGDDDGEVEGFGAVSVDSLLSFAGFFTLVVVGGRCLLPYNVPCRCIFPSLPSRPGEPGESGPPVRRRSVESTSPGRSAPRPGTTPRERGATRRPPGSADGARSPGAPGGPGQGGPPGGEGSRRQLSEKKQRIFF